MLQCIHLKGSYRASNSMVAHSEEYKGPHGRGKEVMMGDHKKRIRSAIVRAPPIGGDDASPRAGV